MRKFRYFQLTFALRAFQIFFIIFLISEKSFAQKSSVNLFWMPSVSVSDTFPEKKLLRFYDAEYTSEGLAFFSRTEKKSAQSVFSSFSLKLENENFIALSNQEAASIPESAELRADFYGECKLNVARGVPHLQIKIIPFRKNSETGKIDKLLSFDYQVLEKKGLELQKTSKTYVSSSVLSQGTWVKLGFSETGVYSLTFDELKSLGLENPEKIKVFANASGLLPTNTADFAADDLIENDILINGSELVFFVQGPNRWDFDSGAGLFNYVNNYYSAQSYYFFTTDYNSSYNNSLKNYSQPAANATNSVNYFNDKYIHNVDNINLSHSGRRWYGEIFDIELVHNISFDIKNIKPSEQAKVKVGVAAYADAASIFSLKTGSSQEYISVAPVGSYSDAVASVRSFIIDSGTSSNMNFELSYARNSPAWKGWLDFIQLNVKRNLVLSDNQMIFSNFETLGNGNITEYTISGMSSGVKIWDITNATRPMNVAYTLSGTVATFKSESTELKQYIVFKPSGYNKTDLTKALSVVNQNLHGISGKTDMLIVTHSDFLSQANEIKQIHSEKDGMSVVVVTSEQVYNEFSSGARDISAIRNFARMIYSRAAYNDTLRYLLLLGDGSYDNKRDTSINSNFIPTYQSLNSESQSESYSTDDYFGLLDTGEGEINFNISGMLDIGVGRISVSTVEQADAIVSKIKSYTSPETFGDWRNKFTFIADDENNMVHMYDADTLTRYIAEFYPEYNIEKIYFDAYPQQTISGGERYPDVNQAFMNRVQKGAAIINYTGHGGEYGLGHERILTISEIDSWKNFEKLPVFVTATCEFTRFDDYNFLTAGERVFLNPKGGGIALFTTARLAYISNNASLTKSFYRNAFKEINGEKPRLGDISRLTKNELYDSNKLIFFLIGDPALHIATPGSHRAVTKTINGNPIAIIDTLKALSKVTFTGEMQDKNGNKLTNYNGFVYPTVFDKQRTVNTLNNDGEGVFTFSDRNSIIYKGKSTITNGNFSFTFIVPRDIMLNIDTGKVSYYAENKISDASGYSFDFLVGDISSNYPEDNQGPEIKLYMNDANFVSGGITDANPKIFALLKDENGINTSSGGIGHDITAVIDNDTKKILVLNEDYRADADTYQSGSLEHFLFEIEAGEHNLKLKVWDVYNNSSEESIDFVVVENSNLKIEHLLNYPNPFTTHTDFYFEHNMPGTNLEVLIQIFTVSGKLVKTIDEVISAEGYRAGPFSWNGTDDFGQKIGRGVYVYRVKVRSYSGEIVEKFEKLLILK